MKNLKELSYSQKQNGSKKVKNLQNISLIQKKETTSRKPIQKLKLPDGSVTTNKEEILQIQKSFYETLYA